ncbi:DUF488 domain-containing protein [Microvirga sp. CF3062]|uniref:DUF488 domain-containing protein n=1 Tax=Microvirga sp. CF3062 TaxID=3110182 RepID=UPI003FA60B84
MGKRIFTFGYEGLSLEVFIARLKSVGVDTILDVRANPLSRKPGFSKTAFSTALQNAGMIYIHMPQLGCPKPVRDLYKADGDWMNYTRGFLSHLKSQKNAVSELVEIAKSSTSCLICFETDHARCHRTYVARAAAKISDLRVIHLTSRTTIPDVVHGAAA